MHCSMPHTIIPRCLCGVLCEYAGISNALFNAPHNHSQVPVWVVGGANYVIAQWAYSSRYPAAQLQLSRMHYTASRRLSASTLM